MLKSASCPKRSLFRIRLENEMEKLTTPNRIWKKLLGNEKSQRFYRFAQKKNTERKTLMTTSRAEFSWWHLTRTWISSGRRNLMSESTTPSYPFFKTASFGAMSMWRLSWALRCLLLIFKPTILEKLIPCPVAYPPCFLRRKTGSSENAHKRISSKPYVFGDTGGDSGEDFINLKFGAPSFPFWIQIISTFTNMMVRACT